MHALSLQHTSCRTKVTPVGLRETSCFGNQTRPGPMAVAACRPSQDTRHLQAQLVLHTCTCGYATGCYGNRGQVIEGSLEVKLPTVWTDKKKRWEDSEKRREEKRRIKKKEDAGARKGRKVANHSVFPLICGWGRSKVGSRKRRARDRLARWEVKNCTPLWRETNFKVKSAKIWRSPTTFGSWDVQKGPAEVARSTFRSQKR